jgi:putative polysaccharide biosynthesis protein
VAVGLTAVLLPTVGLLGAAYVSDVGSLFYVPLHIWIARKFIDLPLRPLLLAMARGLLAAAAMAGVLLAFGTKHLSVLDWIAGGVLGLAAFVAVLVATREIRLADLTYLARYVRRQSTR